jgi:hypothetical protein
MSPVECEPGVAKRFAKLIELGKSDTLTAFWLYPENQFPHDKYHLYLYILAQFQELNGDRTNALASYEKLRSQLGSARSSLVDHSNAAIKRLSK